MYSMQYAQHHQRQCLHTHLTHTLLGDVWYVLSVADFLVLLAVRLFPVRYQPLLLVDFLCVASEITFVEYHISPSVDF